MPILQLAGYAYAAAPWMMLVGLALGLVSLVVRFSRKNSLAKATLLSAAVVFGIGFCAFLIPNVLSLFLVGPA